MENKNLAHRLKNLVNEIIELEKISDIRNSPDNSDVELLDMINKAFYDVDLFLISYNSNNNYHYVDKDYIVSLSIKLFNFYKLYLTIHNIDFYLNNIYESCATFSRENNSKEMNKRIIEELKHSYSNFKTEIKNMSSFTTGEIIGFLPNDLVNSLEKEEIDKDFLDIVISTYLAKAGSFINKYNVCDILQKQIENDSVSKDETKNYKKFLEYLEKFSQECQDLIIDLYTVIKNKSTLITRRVVFLDLVVNQTALKNNL